MSSRASTTDVKPQMLVKETLRKTRKFFNKSFTNIKSYIPGKNRKQSKIPIFSGSYRINSKLHEFHDFYRSCSEKWDSIDVVDKKEGQLSPKMETKRDEQYSKSESSGLEDLKEEKKASKHPGRKQKESRFLAAHALVQKMKDLEMLDLNDRDHVLDVEEVLHYYSRLTCPAYVEIVDKFFTDMYSEFHASQPSRGVNSSMRKLGSNSLHSSMRSLGPLKL